MHITIPSITQPLFSKHSYYYFLLLFLENSHSLDYLDSVNKYKQNGSSLFCSTWKWITSWNLLCNTELLFPFCYCFQSYIYDIFCHMYIYIYFRFTNVCNFNRVLYFGANTSCLKKRPLYTTKVSCYLQSSDILFVLCSKNNKNICQNQIIKYASNN